MRSLKYVAWGAVCIVGVRSCYDEGKRTAETLAMDYHRGADVQVRLHEDCISEGLSLLLGLLNGIVGSQYCVIVFLFISACY